MNISYLKAKSTILQTEKSTRMLQASCFLPPPSMPPRRYLLRFRDCLDNRIGTVRIAIRAPVIRPMAFFVWMCFQRPRLTVQTSREGQTPQERQPPELAVWMVLRVSVSELDLRTTRYQFRFTGELSERVQVFHHDHLSDPRPLRIQARRSYALIRFGI